MNAPADCPRCGQAAVTLPACPRCGVIVAKARLAAAAPRPRPTPAAPAVSQGSPNALRTMAGLAVILVGGLVAVRAWHASERQAAATVPAQEAAVRPPRASIDAPPPSLALATPPPVQIRLESTGISADDRDRAEALAQRLLSPSALTQADVDAAEGLLSRNAEEKQLRSLLEAVLLLVASNEQGRKQYAQAVAHLQRAAQVQPTSTQPLLALAQVHLEMGDWTAAEAMARAVIALAPGAREAWRALGFALFRQDRNPEAVEALMTALELQEDPATRGLLERIQKGMADERGMTAQHLSHFNVRYDGETHDAVGREILRALEHHYATLVGALDYEPVATIPVILFSREAYYNASGAPAWSGGVYDTLDGRIRVPIGGLTTSLTPDIDDTLLHELTHAFIADRTKGVVVPREIQEGMAQYMEGKRADSILTAEQMTLLADGRLGGVGGFYLGALSYVEYLISIRGAGGMNELLKAMGETRSVDEAFRQVHGTTFRGSRQAWAQRLHQQHGS